jgi:hypothetical protein
MTENPDQIRQDIERTRGELSTDVDALAGKVSPHRIASNQVNRAQSALGRFKDKVMGTATQAGHTTAAAAHTAVDDVKQGASWTADEVKQGASTAGHKMSEAASSVGDGAEAGVARSREQTQGNPLAAGVIAFGVGALLSSLLPASQTERHMAGRAKGAATKHSGQIKQQTTDAVHQTQDNLRQPAQQAAQAVKSTAAQGASTVKDQGRSAAKDTQQQARTAAHDIQQH